MINPAYLIFRARRRMSGITIGTSPYFGSQEATDWFLDALAGSTRYVEFGSGGSTYVAASKGIEFATVDSDAVFLEAVRQKIVENGFYDPQSQTYHHGDIGVTGNWGRPVGYQQATLERREAFRKYSDLPLASFGNDALPDLVLVDGRFRVACALKALRLLRDQSGWTIVVDDYVERPEYHVIEQYAEIKGFVANRMAIISATKDFARDEIDERIRQYELVPD